MTFNVAKLFIGISKDLPVFQMTILSYSSYLIFYYKFFKHLL